jgi:hypothetical protein
LGGWCRGQQEDEQKYRKLIEADDVDGVMELLTNREVEKRVLQVCVVCVCVRACVCLYACVGIYAWP